ncbi:MAG: hypothetical protein AMXMBFR33_28730 [Candidatus Xenobia bacterium]|jgi:TM2 domain-containing membrane protein YozV
MSDETPKPKNWLTPQLKAALLSKIFPGAGQFYNRQYVKGGFFLGGALVTLIAGVIYLARGFYIVYSGIVSLADPGYSDQPDPITAIGPGLLLIGLCLGIWLLAIVDAWKTSKRLNPAAATPPPERSEPRREISLPPPPPS